MREEIRTDNSDEHIGFVEQGYDKRGNVNKLITNLGGKTNTQQYLYVENSFNSNSESYSKDGLASAYVFSGNRYATYDYDSLNRLTQRKLTTNIPLYNNYIYKLSATRNTDGGNRYRTTQLSTEFIVNDSYTYTYDAVGNITSVKKGTRASTSPDSEDFKTVTGAKAYRSYEYDALGQLTRENNKTDSKTRVWEYDRLGNIQARTDYAYTTAESITASRTQYIDYKYGADANTTFNKLLKYIDVYNGTSENKSSRHTINYDAIGNPVEYIETTYDADGNVTDTTTSATLKWRGRQLMNLNIGSTTASFLYDADGLRGSKTVNGVKTTYIYVGDKLMYESRSNGLELYYFYDSRDNLSVIRYINGDKDYHFYVTTNAQGDVLGIYSSAGVLKASYEYDAWGNATVTDYNSGIDIGNINPIRYRGYYYDTETGLYYLQSRYYEPRIGRFLNRDDVTDSNGGVLGYNLFAYCANNPINCADPTGHGKILDWIKNKLDKAVEFIDSAPGRILAYCSDVKNNSNLYGTLDNLIMVKDVVDFGVNCYTAQNDIQTHAENIVRVAQNPDYKVRELSDNIAIDYDSYTLTCKGTASNLRNYAPMTYNKPVSEFTEADIAKFAKNLSVEDKAFWGLYNEAYGKKCVEFVMKFSLP